MASIDEPDGAVYLHFLARAMIHDYANLTGSKALSWKRYRSVIQAAKKAEKFANFGSSPRALEFLVQELTVQLADLTLRVTEAARGLADGFGED